MTSGCQHSRTEPIYRQGGEDYVRCLECSHIFEAEDLETVSVFEEEDTDG
jgi:hypothetical protein